jgi:hypothetical protein
MKLTQFLRACSGPSSFMLASLVLAGCGGGGGASSENTNTLPLVAQTSAATTSSDNSYRNFKQIGLSPKIFPVFGEARAFGNFSGSTDVALFIANLNYSPSTSTPQTAAPSTFSMYQQQPDGSYAIDTTLLSSNTGCIHPRKAVVADFNLDGKQDVFVACHGYDASPFPGEQNKIVLSQPNGTYQTANASTDVGFFHSAAAADLNGDGYPDVVVTDNFDSKSILVLINQKDGTFQRESGTRIPISLGGKNYFSVELVDINGDEMLDLLVGGHEWEGADTLAYLNPGNNIFEGASPINTPSVDNEGVVLDFVVTGSGTSRQLWVLRTSGGDGTFYQSRVLQRVNLSDLSSAVVINDRPAEWVRWIIPIVSAGQNLVSSDRSSDNFSFAY